MANLYRAIDMVVDRAYRRSVAAYSFLGRMRVDGLLTHRGPRDQNEVVIEALTALRGADRELLQLAYWDQLTELEMALVTGRGIDILRVDLERARVHLRTRLARSDSALSEQSTAEVVVTA